MIAAFVAGFAAVAILLGGGSAFAYWTATAAATGTTTSTAVTVTQQGFANLATTYRNSSLASSGATLVRSAGSFRISNTGTEAGIATLALTGTGPLSSMAVRVWPADASGCASTPPASAATGTWASTRLTGMALASGQSATVCVQASAERATLAAAGGIADVTVTANVTLDASGWAATAATAVAVHKTSAIFPLSGAAVPVSGSRWVMLTPKDDTTRCLDVDDAQPHVGSAVSTYKCYESSAADRTNPNRLWQMIPVSADRSLVTFRPAHAPTRRLGLKGDAGPDLALAAADAASPAQQWYLQDRGDGGHLVVNALNGLCMAEQPGQNAPVRLVECDSSAAVSIGISAPTQPRIIRASKTRMTIDVGFYRINMNGVKYSARIVSNTGNMSCTTLGVDIYNPPVNDSIRTISCTSVPEGTHVIEVHAANDTAQVIHRMTVVVTGSAMTLQSVDG